MCGWLLWVLAFHHFLYLSHLDTSDNLFECSSPLWLPAERGKMRGREIGPVSFTVVLSQYFFFYRTLSWWFRNVSFVSGNGSRSAYRNLHSLSHALLLASHPCVLQSLHSHTPGVYPQVWYPKHLMIWLRHVSKKAHDRTDSLSCPESLSDFKCTRVIPFYSWYEGK